MDLSEIQLIWAVIKHGIPAAEAAWTAAKPQLSLEGEDVKAAVAALEKAFVDAKGAIGIIETAVKAAVQS